MNNKACRKLEAQHLTLGLNSGKAELLQEAFQNVVDKEGGLKVIAKKTKLPLRQLKQAMADREAFQMFVDIGKIIKGLGGQMAFVNHSGDS